MFKVVRYWDTYLETTMYGGIPTIEEAKEIKNKCLREEKRPNYDFYIFKNGVKID